MQDTAQNIDIKFSHVQLYVDHVCPVEEYKAFEAEVSTKLRNSELVSCSFVNRDDGVSLNENVPPQRNLISSIDVETVFRSHGRDVVKVG